MTFQTSFFVRLLPYFFQIVFVLLLGLFLNACQTRQTPAPIRETSHPKKTHTNIIEEDIYKDTSKPTGQKVALLLPLSGKHSSLGKAMQQAAELALFEKADNQIELSIHDTKGTAEGARQAANQAIQNQSGLILGPIMADEVKAAGEVARYYNINVIAFSNNKAVAGSGVFTLGFSPEEQIQAITVYAAKNGLKKLVVLSPHSNYGQLLDQEIARLHQQGRIQLMEVVHYSPDMKNPNKELNPLRGMNYQALFIPEGGQTLNRLILNMQNANIRIDDVKLLGTGQWDEPQTLQNPSLYGSWIVGPETSSLRMFDEKYVSAYGEPAPRLASLAYDAIAMVSVLKAHFPESPYGIQAITQPRGFDGVNGVFRFMPDGTAERKLAILEVSPAGLRTLQASSKSF